MKSQVPDHSDFKEFIKCLLAFILLFAVIVLTVFGASGCGKITMEVVGEPDVYYHSDPVVVLVTGNTQINPVLPTGNYFISGNELIIR